jgi:tetratricopeptide (TPR) repeat protein
MYNRSVSCRKLFTRPRYRYLHIYFLTILIFSAFLVVGTRAGAYVDEDRFFSYNRFFLNQSVVGGISDDGKIQRELNRFIVSFTDGVYAISGGELQKAKKDLLIARNSWPEYFATDFLLALIYEDQGDHGMAARYYKSYLNKLKNLQDGKYRISEALIRSFVPHGIEEYDVAHRLVQRRLDHYGISLNKVRPVFASPVFLLPILLGAGIVAVYILVFYWLRPRLKRRHWIKNPPEGFWVCRNCDTANPELSWECGECGRPRA